ncbi:MAG: Ig-like domain-containing protein [Gammaproteobacteria bacterium]
MFKLRSLAGTGLAIAALALSLPATAGTLAPQLRALAASYHQAPQATVAQAAHLTNTRVPRFLTPHVNAAGEVQIYIHYRPGEAPSRATLARIGASKILVSQPLGVVQAWVSIAKLNAASALAGVTKVGLPVYGYAKGVGTVSPAADTCNPVPSGLKIDQEGIAAENIGPVLAAGITGAGVKVGVISTGVDCRADSQVQGYLPSNIYITSGLAGSGDEGTAMLEEVHAVAPGASLGFCGPQTTVDFLNCLSDLASWGAKVISDDLGFYPIIYNSPNFPAADGGNAITEFAQANPDITLTSAAGNDAQDYYEANYKTDTNPSSPGGPPISLSPTYTIGGPYKQYEASGRTYNSAMNFGAAVGQGSDAALKITIAPGITLSGDLTWNDPAAGPYDDLDLFLLKQDGSLACQPTSSQWCSSTLNQTKYAGDPNVELPPFEYLSYANNTSSNQTLYLVAFCSACSAHGSNPLHIKLYGVMDGGGIFNYVTDGSIFGHAALAAEFTTAAAQYNGSGVSSTIEPYSSTGPFSYGDWVNGSQTRAKPDVTGTDGVTISGAGGFGGGGAFYGTSAASPNVGAVVALLRSFAPNAETSATGWKQLVMDHANSGALTNYSLDAGGAGLVDAAAALAPLEASIKAAITAPAGSPAKVDPSTNVQFKGDCNYSGTNKLSYQWNFGGNSGIPDSTKLTPDPVQYANGGIYTVTFTCSDPNQSSSAKLTVAVQAAATAKDLSLSTDYDTSATGQFQASGLGGEQVSYAVVDQPTHGSVQTNGTSSFVYTPDSGFSGNDSFTYDVNNGVEKSNTAMVTVTVAAKPTPPPKPPHKGGGGGAFGGLGLGLLGGLAGLLLFLRRKR